MWSVLKVLNIHQHAEFKAVSAMDSPDQARTYQIWPFSQSQTIRKQDVMLFLPRALQNEPSNPKCDQFH